MMTYYNHAMGRTRIKRRYIWAVWAFVGGILCGVTASHLL